VWAAITVFLGWIGFLVLRFFSSKVDENEDMERVPVTIITGFLGCGKTTLVNHILHNESGKRILVIENEIGDESIDHELIFRSPGGPAKEEVIVLSNGCVCCTVRGDLLRSLQDLFKKPMFQTLDWILIETTVRSTQAK
jgi:G3E family GTPase